MDTNTSEKLNEPVVWAVEDIRDTAAKVGMELLFRVFIETGAAYESYDEFHEEVEELWLEDFPMRHLIEESVRIGVSYRRS